MKADSDPKKENRIFPSQCAGKGDAQDATDHNANKNGTTLTTIEKYQFGEKNQYFNSFDKQTDFRFEAW
jgi:hypothetical protein